MLTADNPVMNSQYQQVAIQYGEAQSQRMENIAKAALLQCQRVNRGCNRINSIDDRCSGVWR